MKYEFSECMRRLLIEINPIIGGELEITNESNTTNKAETKPVQLDAPPAPVTKVDPAVLPEAVSWNGARVKEWLNDRDIAPGIMSNILPCNGELLYEYYSMMQNASQFFYTSLVTSPYNQITLRDVAIFSLELKKIFKKWFFIF